MTEKFQPNWINEPPKKNSFRSIFKWGDPNEFKHPNERLYKLIKKTFGLDNHNFIQPSFNTGNNIVEETPPIRISEEIINNLNQICGKENVSITPYERVKYSYGKTLEEAIELRSGNISAITDVIVHPKNSDDIKKIVELCQKNKIPLHVFAGGSSVTLGHRSEKGGITIVISTHMNRVIEFNETDQTIVVEPGIFGPKLEFILNNAKRLLGSKKNYTCGHFPQSFEYSTAGGWVITLGSGQASTYYGDAKDLVISQKYITPKGEIKTKDFPASAAGPDIGSIFLGSEGIFGILVELKLKIFRHMPENKKNFAFIFPTWENAVDAAREISQSEGGVPAVLRISDEEETDVGLKLYGIEATIFDKLMKLKGFKSMQRSLCIGSTLGSKEYSKTAFKNVKKIAKRFGGLYLTGYPTSQWEHGRFKDPYMREDLNDYGVYIDTLETSVKWSNIHKVHKEVRAHIKEKQNIICMTHSSHFYPQGTNLYFIFISMFESNDEYINFHRGIIKKIHEAGGSLSHHHGIGKMMSFMFKEHIGKNEFELLQAIKKHLDPEMIINSKGIMEME